MRQKRKTVREKPSSKYSLKALILFIVSLVSGLVITILNLGFISQTNLLLKIYLICFFFLLVTLPIAFNIFLSEKERKTRLLAKLTILLGLLPFGISMFLGIYFSIKNNFFFTIENFLTGIIPGLLIILDGGLIMTYNQEHSSTLHKVVLQDLSVLIYLFSALYIFVVLMFLFMGGQSSGQL